MLSKSYSSRERKSYAKSYTLKITLTTECISLHRMLRCTTLQRGGWMHEEQTSSQFLSVLHERAVAITST